MQIEMLRECKALGYAWVVAFQKDKKEGEEILEQP